MVAKPRCRDLSARYLAFVDSAPVLMTDVGFPFAEGFGNGGRRRGDDAGDDADKRLAKGYWPGPKTHFYHTR